MAYKILGACNDKICDIKKLKICFSEIPSANRTTHNLQTILGISCFIR